MLSFVGKTNANIILTFSRPTSKDDRTKRNDYQYASIVESFSQEWTEACLRRRSGSSARGTNSLAAGDHAVLYDDGAKHETSAR